MVHAPSKIIIHSSACVCCPGDLNPLPAHVTISPTGIIEYNYQTLGWDCHCEIMKRDAICIHLEGKGTFPDEQMFALISACEFLDVYFDKELDIFSHSELGGQPDCPGFDNANQELLIFSEMRDEIRKGKAKEEE